MRGHGRHGGTIAAAGAVLCAAAVCAAGGAPKAGAPNRQAPASTNVVTITSQRLTFDYGRSVAVFTGNVVVSDGDMRIESDRLTVAFSGTNELKWVEAEGDVRLRRGEDNGSCDELRYSPGSGRGMMKGNAAMHRSARQSVWADEITFTVEGNQIRSGNAKGNVRMKHVGSGNGNDWRPQQKAGEPRP